MKATLLVSLAALAASVIAVGLSLMNQTQPGTGSDRNADASVARPAPDVTEQIEALADENAELRARLAMLEASAPSAQRAPAVDHVTKAEFDAFRDQVLGAKGGGVGAVVATKDTMFKEQVAATLDEIRESEQADKREATLQRRVDRLDELLPKLEVQLGLTGPQSDGLRLALTERYERNAELERRWQAGESAEVLGEVKAEDYRVFQDSLSSILNSEQLEGYHATTRASGGKK